MGTKFDEVPRCQNARCMELNGRQIWEDGTAELEKLESRMNMDYELPPLDFIG